MQKTIENGITILIADTGLKLTNGNAFGTTVRLAKSDSPDNWREVTGAEAERLMEEAEKEELPETEQKALAYDILMGVRE